MPTLTARVNVRANRGNGVNKPRFSKLSDITIVAAIRSTDGKSVNYAPVATRTIPGVWDSNAALAESPVVPQSVNPDCPISCKGGVGWSHHDSQIAALVGGESGIKSNRHAVDLLHGFLFPLENTCQNKCSNSRTATVCC